jgi:putative intracellular protease/amidase
VCWLFHSSDLDLRYLASVVATFAHDVEDVRISLHQYADLGLAGARRIGDLIQAQGLTAAHAHHVVSAAARVAWMTDRPLPQVIADDRSLGLEPGQVHDAVDGQHADTLQLARRREAELLAMAGFREPIALASMSDSDMGQFDGLFVSGGYGAMVDLHDNHRVGRLVAVLHRRRVPIAALGHGLAALLSAPERADGLWLFEGYRLTSITDEEENQTETGLIGMDWRLDAALKNAGGLFDDGSSAWVSHVVVDRNLITGQNPASTEATVEAFLRALGVRTRSPTAAAKPALVDEGTLSTSRTPQETVADFLHALGNGSVATAMTVVASTASATIQPLRGAGTGTDVLRQTLSDFVLSFADLRIEVDRVITTGNVATVLFRMGGTQAAEYGGAPSLNKHADVDHAWRFVVVDGMITEVAAYWCQAQLYRRIGVKRYADLATA